MLTVFFTDQPVTDYASAKTSDAGRYARFFWSMLEQGVYLPPSQFEAAFLPAAFTPEDFRTVATAATAAFAALATE